MLCDRVAIMAAGRIVCTGSPASLRQRYGRTSYRVNLKLAAGNCPSSSVEQLLHARLTDSFTQCRQLVSRLGWLRYTVHHARISSILGVLAGLKADQLVDSFTIDVTSLEDIFLEIAGETNLGFEHGSDDNTNQTFRKRESDGSEEPSVDVPQQAHYVLPSPPTN